MELIHFQGLNCFHDCVITLANHFELHYSAAFSTLWSEADFRYDPYRKVFLTKRMIANLADLGVKVECTDCFTQEDREKHFALFLEGEFIIVGMDAFYIPWNQFYQTFHGPHYFIAGNTGGETCRCFDPTYNKKGEEMARRDILAHTFDVCRVGRGPGRPLLPKPAEEAREVLRAHPQTRWELEAHFYACVEPDTDKGGEELILAAKRVDAMIHNRHLFRFFLEHLPDPREENDSFLASVHFQEWQAVKNGLYKAAVSKDRERLVQDVCARLGHVMDEEMAIAEGMISPGVGLF